MSLSAVHLRFEARLASPDHGLRYLGPTLRGAFGKALKSTVCQQRHGECARCLLLQACPYPAIFEGRPQAGQRSWTAPAAPQPFVLTVAPPFTWDGDSSTLRWGLTLLGFAAAWSPYVVEAFMRIGKHGIGKTGTQYALERVTNGVTGEDLCKQGEDTMRPPAASPLVLREPPTDGVVRWRLHTPLHIRESSTELHSVDGLALIQAGRRRWRLLESFYGNPPDPICAQPNPALPKADAFVTREIALRAWDIERYSGRQQRRVTLAGLIGEAVIEGPWSAVGPWIRSVEQINLGKYASFGFGRVTWEML